MGMTIHITVPHNITDVSLGNIADIFRPLDDVFNEIVRYYSRFDFKYPSQTWASRDTSYYRGSYPGSYAHVPVGFDAPAGFSFFFGPHTLSIHHYTRLGLFCTDPDIRQLLRSFSKQVLELVSGESAIYSPDDYGIFDLIFAGKMFSEIEAHLLRLEAPASSFADFESSSAQPRYYIDRFRDFSLVKTSVA